MSASILEFCDRSFAGHQPVCQNQLTPYDEDVLFWAAAKPANEATATAADESFMMFDREIC